MNRKVSLWMVTIVTILLMVGSELPTPLYDVYSKRFHFSQIVLTLIYAAYVGGVVLGLLFFGRLSDQIGRKYTAVPAIGFAAVATVLFVFVHGPGMLFAARSLYGLAAGLASGTTAAWISDLYPSDDETAGSAMVCSADMGGQGIGPLLTGVLTQYAPLPTRLTYLVFLAVLLPGGVLAWKSKETVDHPRPPLREISLKPRMGVPREQMAAFLPPAATAFSIFALLGFYTALAPTLLTKTLHITSHLVAGAIVTELYASAVAAILLSRKMKSRPAMLTALGVLVPALAAMMGAELFKSMPILIVATTLAGVAGGLGFRGSLEVVNHLSPEDRRAEVLSTYFLIGNLGVAVPVIGVGVLTQLASGLIAHATFAGLLTVLAVAAWIAGRKYSPDE
jgi:MFS family permease